MIKTRHEFHFCQPIIYNFVTSWLLRWRIVSTTPNSQVGGPHFVGCPRLLIQYIRSYPSYLEANVGPFWIR